MKCAIPGSASASDSFGSSAWVATISSPNAVTTSEPLSEDCGRARTPHASWLTSRAPRNTPRPTHTVRNAPRSKNHNRPCSEAATPCAIVAASAAVIPAWRARSAGSEPTSSLTSPSALIRSSAKGICHGKIR